MNALKKWKLLLASVTATLAMGITINSNACSLVFLNNNAQAKVFARSMDLYIPDMPHLVVYPEGVIHSGQTSENPIQWTSKYGSVVVTEFNSDAASDGINEKGLAAHLLYLDGSKYEPRDAKQLGLSNLLWAQYILDNYTTVDEVIANLNKYQIQATTLHGKEWPIHIAVEDATGDSAVIEYINGKQVVHHGPQYRVMTNEPTYDEQLANLKNYKLFGGSLPMPGDIDPLSRFVRASSYLKTLPKPDNEMQVVADALAVLRTTMVPFGAEDTSASKISTDTWPTRWVTLGDLTHKIYYFNSTEAPNIVWVDLNNINFSKGNSILILDPTDPTLVGEVSKQFSPRS